MGGFQEAVDTATIFGIRNDTLQGNDDVSEVLLKCGHGIFPFLREVGEFGFDGQLKGFVRGE